MLYQANLGTALLVCALAVSVQADTLWVDASHPACPGSGTASDPFCTIQDAVDAAASSDTVIVKPGTYLENVTIADKSVTLIGRGGPTLTTIRGGQELPVVTVLGAGGAGTVIQGFTVTGGKGLVVGGTTFLTELAGAGIYADTDVTIRDNVVEGNAFATSVTNVWEGRGGGIAVFGATAQIEGNLVRANTGTLGCGIYYAGSDDGHIVANVIEDHGTTSGRGGGMAIDGASPLVADNVIRNNVSTVGAGLAIESGAAPLVTGNTIVDNHTDEDEGGGVLIVNSSPVLRGNTLRGNTAVSWGGGVFTTGGAPVLADNVIEDNWASIDGGGIWSVGAATIEGNEVVDNFTFGRTGGIAVHGATSIVRNVIRDHEAAGLTIGSGAPLVADNLILRNATGIDRAAGNILRNTVTENVFDGITVEDGATPLIESCIVWGNGPSAANEIFVFSGAPSVRFCDVRGGHAGTDNIAVDPQFVDPVGGDHRLAPGSPCIDAGQPADAVCGLDLADHPRRLDGLLDGPQVVDMGALEFGHVALAAQLTPGQLDVQTTGTAGLPVFMIYAVQPDLACVSAYGPLLFDISLPWTFTAWGSNPTQTSLVVPPVVPVPSIVLQALVLTGGGQFGNLSNAELVEFR